MGLRDGVENNPMAAAHSEARTLASTVTQVPMLAHLSRSGIDLPILIVPRSEKEK
jgi:hypothetical protein